EIRNILASNDFDGLSALESHLTALLARRAQLNLLVANVEKTIKTMKGEMIMSDQEKFEGFLQKLVDQNERQYGEEVRKKYGDERINRSNTKVLNMSKEQFTELERLTEEL
ncbi:TipAS antibiotic-recognition domain-containing protein, partial [Clostridioides difficile]|nr:TipAS antibiotic-recognition domain-containing protein [Clostridioides difficile]